MRAKRFLALMVLAAAPAWADYKAAYSEALKALNTGKWAEVARLMREAAAEQPTEGERIRLYRMRFGIYLPHFYLGQALVETGDCAGALKAFATSEEQGVVKKTYHWGELQDLRNRCQQQPQATVPTPTGPAAPPTPDPSGEIRTAEAEQVTQEEAQRQALWRELAALSREAASLEGSVGSTGAWPELRQAKADLGQSRARAVAMTATSTADELKARRDELRQTVERLRQALAAVQPASSPTVPPAPTAPVTVATTGPAGAPPTLRQGSETFLAADYRRTVELLDQPLVAEPRAAALAALIRGAARHALFLEAGGREAVLLEAVRSDIRTCRRLDATMAPDTAFFSPIFVSLFEKTR